MTRKTVVGLLAVAAMAAFSVGSAVAANYFIVRRSGVVVCSNVMDFTQSCNSQYVGAIF